MKLDYIKIEGYKSFKKIKLDLQSINVLIGANGAGKSNFISFFSFLNTAYNEQLEAFIKGRGIDTILHNGRKQTDKLFAQLSFNNETNAYDFSFQVQNKTLVSESEILWYRDNSWINSQNDTELRIKNNTTGRARYINQYLNELRVYHFHDTGEKSPFNSDNNIIDNRILQTKGGNLAAFLYCLQSEHPIIYKRIVKVIQSIAPYFRDFDLQPNNNKIDLAWRDLHSENLYGASDLSDGTIRFIALTTLFLQPNPPAVIIIDEPELGLHPFAINKLAGLIKSASERDVQVILSTQSVELVNCFKAEDIITVDNKSGETTLTRLDNSDLSEWLEDYTVGDMWRQNLLDKGFPNK